MRVCCVYDIKNTKLGLSKIIKVLQFKSHQINVKNRKYFII